jgi:hypothetical protein
VSQPKPSAQNLRLAVHVYICSKIAGKYRQFFPFRSTNLQKQQEQIKSKFQSREKFAEVPVDATFVKISFNLHPP